MKQMLFVFNPRSGKEQIRGSLLRILDIFTKDGYDIHVHVTQSQGDASRIVKSWERAWTLSCAAEETEP